MKLNSIENPIQEMIAFRENYVSVMMAAPLGKMIVIDAHDETASKLGTWKVSEHIPGTKVPGWGAGVGTKAKLGGENMVRDSFSRVFMEVYPGTLLNDILGTDDPFETPLYKEGVTEPTAQEMWEALLKNRGLTR